MTPEPLDRFAYSFRAKGEIYCPLQRFGFPKLRDPFLCLNALRVQVSAGPAQDALEQEYADILATPIVINLCASHQGVLLVLPVLMRL